MSASADRSDHTLQPGSLDSRDVVRVEAFMSRIYSRMQIGATGPDTRARITRRVVAPEIGFDDLDYSFDLGYAAEPQTRMIICDVVSSTVRRDERAGEPETFGPGDQFLITRPGEPYAGAAHASRLRFTVVDPAILARVALTADGGHASVRILDHRPVSKSAALQLQQCIAAVRKALLMSSNAPAPLVASTASHYLAATVLHTYPNSAVGPTGPGERRDAHPTTLQRAISFIEQNPDQDMSLADIAAAAYVTPRAVQLAFRRHLDVTPLAYLRRVRLDHARADLLAAGAGDGQTVTTIAARWGFVGSRFADQYRAAYGELPSATLRP